MTTWNEHLRLEVAEPPPDLVNLVENPNGELGGYGWVTPGQGGFITSTGTGALRMHIPMTVYEDAAYTAGNNWYTAPFPVAPGYIAASWTVSAIRPPAMRSTVKFEFLDSNYEILSESTPYAPLFSHVGSNAYGTYPVPADATYGQLVFRTPIQGIPNNGELQVGDDGFLDFHGVTVVITPTDQGLVSTRTNHIELGSFEDNAGQWSQVGPTNQDYDIDQVADDTAPDGTHVVRFIGPTSGEAATAYVYMRGTTRGADYRLHFYSKSPTAGKQVNMVLKWDGLDGIIEQLDFTATTSWTHHTFRVLTRPENSTHTPQLEITIPSTPDNEVRFDAFMFEQGTTIGDYFDGNTTSPDPDVSYYWAGTPSASSSHMVTSHLDYIPPRTYQNILGPTHEMRIVREELNLGTLNATVLHTDLEPTTSDLIRPGRRVRLLARDPDTGEWRPLFTGDISNARVTYHLNRTDEKHARIELSATDAAQKLAGASRPNTVAHIADLPQVLEGTGVAWNVNGSGDQVNATVVARNDSATAADQVALTRDSTLGYAWVDQHNILQAWDADQLPPAAPVVLDETTFSDVDIDYDTERCINEVLVTFLRYNPVNAETDEIVYGPYTDRTSVATWGRRTGEFTIAGDVEDPALIAAYAQRILDANATPEVRVNGLTLPIRDTADLAARGYLDLYDLVTTRLTSKNIDKPARVTAVEHTITPDQWSMEARFTAEHSVAPPQLTPPVNNAPAGLTIASRYQSSDQAIPHATWTNLDLDTADTIAAGITYAGWGKFTAATPGVYSFSASLVFRGGHSGGPQHLRLLRNDAPYFQASKVAQGSATDAALWFTSIVACQAGDVLTIQGRQAFGDTNNTFSGPQTVNATVYKIGSL